MPAAQSIRMFSTMGLVACILFSLLCFRLFALQWSGPNSQTLALGTAPEYVLMFGSLFIVAYSLNPSHPAYRIKGRKFKAVAK